MDPAPVTEHDERVSLTVHQNVAVVGAPKVGVGQSGRTIALLVALSGMAGPSRTGPPIAREPIGDRAQDAFDAGRQALGRGFGIVLRALDTVEHTLRPLQGRHPGCGLPPGPDLVESFASRSRPQQVQAQAPNPTPTGRRHHLEAERHARVVIGRAARRHEPPGSDLPVDSVVHLGVPERGEEIRGQLPAGDDDRDRCAAFDVQTFDLGVLARQEPLAEVDESGEAAGAPAREHFARSRLAVVAVVRVAAQTGDTPRPKNGPVTDQPLDFGSQLGFGARHRIGPLFRVVSQGHSQAEIEGRAASTRSPTTPEVSQGMPVEQDSRRAGQGVGRVAERAIDVGNGAPSRRSRATGARRSSP